MSRWSPSYEMTTHVVADPVKDLGLEYTSYKKEVIPGTRGRSYIKEDVIDKRNEIDVMEGYNASTASHMNQHSIYHFYQYESETRFLDLIPRNTIGKFPDHELMSTRFLACRYVICLLDEALQEQKPVELMAMRLNGDVYIGANKSLESDSRECNEAAFGGLNFAKMVTTGDPSFQKHHSVVKELRLENVTYRTGMCIYVSSVVRAFDSNNNIIELKTVSSNVAGKLQNLSASKARKWWLRALLSGSDRIVYGLRRRDMIVHQVNEAKLEDFTRGHFHFNPSSLFAFVFDLFQKISFSIPDEGDMCLVNTDGNKPVIEVTDVESLKRSPFW